MEKFADLHIHTNFSDGTYTPEEIVDAAAESGLSCISITDHDTIEGVELAIKAGQAKKLEVSPGIEMSAEVDNLELHILGYFIDYHNKDLLEKLSKLKQIRIERIHNMVEKLNELGLDKINAEEVIELSGEGAVGRVHLAMIMKRRGYVNSISEAFYRYIKDNGPAYVSKFRFSPKEIINSIHKAGGVTAIAHPHTLKNDESIGQLADYGLKAIEVYYSDYTNSQIKRYLSLAKKYGLLITGGSDFHGEAKKNTSIGKIKIPYELVEELKQAR